MRKLIYKNIGARQDFRKEIEAVQKKCNLLIDSFNSAQDFARINTLSEAEKLIQNPVEYFDNILIENCEIKSKTGRLPEPGTLASLFGINRDGYLEAIGWEIVPDKKCKGCTTAQIKLIRQKDILTPEHYFDNAAYLLFENGAFELNEAAIAETGETFDIYAESTEQLQLVEHYESLCKVLNEAILFHKVGSDKVQIIAQAFGFLLTEKYELLVDYYGMINQIKFLK